MKKLLLSASLIITTASFAQTAFWTETFGTGCNPGQLASSYSGTNGPWAITSTGTNDTYADGWFVSARASGTGAQNCSDNCSQAAVTDQTLHVGNAAIPLVGFGADTGSTYLTGTFCGSGICSTTHKRAESPSINTVSRDSVGISFLYYEGGELMGDEATLWYSPDNGVTWTMIDQLAKISNSCAAPSGLWTEFSMLLPPSASNNAVGIKIAFEWVNDNDGVGGDPSFAVDDVTLLENMPMSIQSSTAQQLSLVTHESSVTVNAQSPWKVLSVVDVTGREIQVSTSSNEIYFNEPAGVYFIRMEMNGEESVHRVLFAQ
jgi:hypothetical protein